MLGHGGNVYSLGFTQHTLGYRQLKQPYFTYKSQGSRRRQCIVYASETKPDPSFTSTIELDRFIDKLRNTDSQQLPQVIAENILSFDNKFWLRLATRTDSCRSEDDKADFEELASNVMQLVERVVQKTEEKIESSTDILLSILDPVEGSKAKEMVWPPRDPEALTKVRKELLMRERGGFLDESFLSEVNAQLRQAKEDADKPGLLALLQKVLQLYAATFLSKTSYATRDGAVDKAEELLEKIIAADAEDWDGLIRSGLDMGGGDVKYEDLSRVAKKRVERVLLRTDAGSYKQRILVEYLKEIERCVERAAEAFKRE